MIRRRKKPKDYKLRAFVAILFLIIVFLVSRLKVNFAQSNLLIKDSFSLQVGYAYIMYNHKIMSRLYFENIKFSSEKRLLQVFDAKGVAVLSGNVGVLLGTNKALPCKDKPTDGSVCWEWTDLAKLFVSLDSKFTGISSDDMPGTRCFNFRWQSLDDNFSPIDCFNIGEERGHWYGGGLTRDADWQMDRGSFGFAPFITGDLRLVLKSNEIPKCVI